MEHVTYHQLLAEIYDESSKNLLVHETEYEDEEIPPDDKHPDELEDQEEFQQQQPSHASVAYTPNRADYSDKTKLSVQYEKQVLTHVINIDSRFRDFYIGNPGVTANIAFQSLSLLGSNTSTLASPNPLFSSSDFTYVLPIPIKNAISVRMSSIEFPNTFFTFSQTRGNTSFYVVIPSGSVNPLNRRLINVPNGNYTDINLASMVQTLLNNAVSSITNTPGSDTVSTVFSVLIDGGNAVTQAPLPTAFTTTGRIIISTNNATAFDLLLGEDIYGSRLRDFGLGYYLGFRNKLYTGLSSYTTESIVDTTDWPYVFVSFNPDWKVVKHQNQTTNSTYAFAKVMMSAGKNSIVFSNNSNTVTTEYFFHQPTNIISIPVKIVDPYDETLDLLGLDISITLEIKEVLNSSLYETMRAH
jgi:hypothetical protein